MGVFQTFTLIPQSKVSAAKLVRTPFSLLFFNEEQIILILFLETEVYA